jgi:hypothetical protein
MEGFFVSGFLLCTTLIFLFFPHFNEATSGLMDYPVAAMMLLGLTALYRSLTKNAGSELLKENLLFAMLLLGLTSITKQAGALGLAPAIYVIMVARLRGLLSTREVFTLIAFSLLPVLLYLVMFIPKAGNPIGTLALLSSLSDKQWGHANKFTSGLVQVIELVPRWYFVLLAIGSAMNFLTLSRFTSRLGLICLASAAGGFVVYADCCSYAARNGIWIFSLLTTSAMCGLSSLDAKFKELQSRVLVKYQEMESRRDEYFSTKVLAHYIIIMGVVGAIEATFILRAVDLRDIQEEYQKDIGYPRVNALLYSHRDKLSNGAHIITDYEIAGWLPGIGDRYIGCQEKQDDCVEQYLKKYPGSLVLLEQRSDFPAVRARLAKQDLLGEADDWQLFQPQARD